MTCAIIMVTHNSQRYLPRAMAALRGQTRPADQVVIVDSGSTDTTYLTPYANAPDVSLVLAQGDIGFCEGNNVGVQHLSRPCDYVFFVNPDLFLTPHYIEKAIAFMELPEQRGAAGLTGTTLGYDIEADCPTGRYDTTGVFSTWYGRWYDRGQGQWQQPALFQAIEEVPAICGAIFFCRRKALDEVVIRGGEIFDNTFYMYKEDIDLSLRLRHRGWKLIFAPALVAYHCRGWSSDRSRMPRWCRLHSARNELRIHRRLGAPHKMLYSSLKWAAVQLFDA